MHWSWFQSLNRELPLSYERASNYESTRSCGFNRSIANCLFPTMIARLHPATLEFGFNRSIANCLFPTHGNRIHNTDQYQFQSLNRELPLSYSGTSSSSSKRGVVSIARSRTASFLLEDHPF